MSLKPCSVHGTKVGGKLAVMYAAWFNGTGERVCYKLRLCAHCYTQLMGSLVAHPLAESSQLVVCPTCGTDSSTDLDGLYLTLYVPKRDATELALTTCSSCAVSWHASFAENGELQPNRFAGNKDDDSDWEKVPA